MITIQGGNSNLLRVDSTNSILVINPSVINSSGNPSNTGNYTTQVCELAATGGLQYQASISDYYREKIGYDNILFYEHFNNGSLSTTINAKWIVNNTTMTTVLSGGVVTMNNSGILTGSAVMYSDKMFTKWGGYPLSFETTLRITQPTTSSTVDKLFIFGLYAQTSSGTTQTIGVYFRIQPNGTLWAVIASYGTWQTSPSISNADTVYQLTMPSLNVFHRYKIVMNEDNALFYIDNVLQTQLFVSQNNGPLLHINNARIYYSLTIPQTSSIITKVLIDNVCVSQLDIDGNKQFSTMMSDNGCHISQSQQGESGGPSTCNMTNNMAIPTAVALQNTTAINFSSSTNWLGGWFSILPTLTANTDGIICAYTKGVASTTVLAKNMFITSVTIQGWVLSALTGGPVIYEYSMTIGNTNISLATTETTTSKAPRWIPLGFESYPLNSAANVLGRTKPLVINFMTPYCVQPNEFVSINAKNIGTVTSAGSISVIISIGGWCE